MSPAGKENINHDKYRRALQLAQEMFAGFNFEEQCSRAGAEIIERGLARVKFIQTEYLAAHPSGELRVLGSEAEPLPYDRLLVLHYLAHAKGTPLTGELISYQQIPDGWLYYPTFLKRTIRVLAKAFSGDVASFLQAGESIGAKRSLLGEHALEILALPKVSYHFIMWPGDDELDTDFSCVFDRSVTDYLPAEDITLLTNVISSLLANSRKGKQG